MREVEGKVAARFASELYAAHVIWKLGIGVGDSAD